MFVMPSRNTICRPFVFNDIKLVVRRVKWKLDTLIFNCLYSCMDSGPAHIFTQVCVWVFFLIKRGWTRRSIMTR